MHNTGGAKCLTECEEKFTYCRGTDGKNNAKVNAKTSKNCVRGL